MGTMNAHRYMNPNDILRHLFLAKFTEKLIIEQKKQFSLLPKSITTKNVDPEQKTQVNINKGRKRKHDSKNRDHDDDFVPKRN